MTAFSLIISACSRLYVSCYKDKFRDLFPGSKIKTNDFICLGVDREALKEWWSESVRCDKTFEFWYEWICWAEETETLPEYLKNHGYTFKRTDFFTVEATKGE